jgi:hypothetical protein
MVERRKIEKKEQGSAVSGAAQRQGIATLRSREKSKKKTGAVVTSRGSAGTRTRLSGAQRRRDVATLGSWLQDGEKSNKNKGGGALKAAARGREDGGEVQGTMEGRSTLPSHWG